MASLGNDFNFFSVFGDGGFFLDFFFLSFDRAMLDFTRFFSDEMRFLPAFPMFWQTVFVKKHKV